MASHGFKVVQDFVHPQYGSRENCLAAKSLAELYPQLTLDLFVLDGSGVSGRGPQSGVPKIGPLDSQQGNKQGNHILYEATRRTTLMAKLRSLWDIWMAFGGCFSQKKYRNQTPRNGPDSPVAIALFSHCCDRFLGVLSAWAKNKQIATGDPGSPGVLRPMKPSRAV